MAGHVFIDETKQRDYLVVAGVLAVGDLNAARRTLRALVLPGQRRIHMAKEGTQRRRSLLSVIAELDVKATVYDGGRAAGREHVAREACLRAVVADAARESHEFLVVEQDDSLVRADRRVLFAAVHEHGCVDTLRYEHRRAETELLLALPDAIAWAWAKGCDWRARIEGLIAEVKKV